MRSPASVAARVLTALAVGFGAGCEEAAPSSVWVGADLRALVEDRLDRDPDEPAVLQSGAFVRYLVLEPAGTRLELEASTEGGATLTLLGIRGEELEETSWSIEELDGLEGFELETFSDGAVEIELFANEGDLTIARAVVNQEREPVDVVWIVVDTLRADHVFDPDRPVDLPNLDAFAADAIVFPHAHAHAPMTLPAHAAMLTARHPFETGVLCNGQWGELPDDAYPLGPWLDRVGYDTSAVLSMATVGERWRERTLFPGFDHYDRDFRYMVPAAHVDGALERMLARLPDDRPAFAFVHYSDPHAPYSSHGTRKTPVEVRLDGEELGTVNASEFDRRAFDVELGGQHELVLESDRPFKVRAIDVLVDGDGLPLEWVESEPEAFTERARCRFRDERLVERAAKVVVWTNDRVTKEEIAPRYAAETRHVDEYLGRLFDRLRASGRYDGALIVFTSDHGEELGDHGAVGHVETLFEEVLHVPLAIKLPAGHPSEELLRARTRGLVRHVDLVPTVLDLAGLPRPPVTSGRSLLTGNPPLHLAETHRPEASRDLVSVQDLEWKMVYVVEEDRFELYDLFGDPGETRDVFERHRAERPTWPELLRRAAEATRGEVRIDGSTREELEALGYF